MKGRICTVILVIVAVLSGCDKKEYLDYVDCVYKDKAYGEWELVNSEAASKDGQEMFSLDGHEVTNEFSADVSIELLEAMNVELGYSFSISSLKCSGTSAVIDAGQTIEFYCRPVYDVYEITVAVYSDEDKEREKGRELMDFHQLWAAQYGWVIYDENDSILEDTRDNPVDVNRSDEPEEEEPEDIDTEEEESDDNDTEGEGPVEPTGEKTVTSEEEPNGSVEEADFVTLNQDIYGRLNSEDDLDYYKFHVDSKGSMNLLFKHGKIDSNDTFWNISLLNGLDDEMIMETGVTGSTSEFFSNKMRIAPGDYVLKIEHYYYSDMDYVFQLVFTSEDDSYELEKNNSFENANPIWVNQTYTGNLQNESDVDYFAFEIPVKGKLWIDFYHDKFDSSDIYWHAEVQNDLDDRILLGFDAAGGVNEYNSDVIRVPAGKYYLKIGDYYYSNMDYRFCINYVEENENFESEPNNDCPEANEIVFSTEYTGNIQSNNDADYYHFYNDILRNINVGFMHQMTDSSDTFWCVRIISGHSDEDWGRYYVAGSDENSQNFLFENIPEGDCYLIVEHDHYNNFDYTFRID